MRITRMELTGSGYTASIHRGRKSETIEVLLSNPDGQQEHHVDPDGPEDVYSMAQCLQYHLDGCKGTGSMVQEYYRILQYFMD